MNLTVQHRENTGKGFNRRLRQAGVTPGVIYGKEETLNVSMTTGPAQRFIRSMKGSKKVINLVIESTEGTANKTVILQDYQLTNLGNNLVHVDFLEVTQDSIVSFEIPIKLKNEAACPALKTGGVIQIIRRAIPVRCIVREIPNLPESLEIDLINLEFGESIHVLDVVYPEGVEPVVTGRNFTVVTVAGRSLEEVDEGEEEVEDEEESEKEQGEPKED
ncbi:MAG: 50S ribosomal protein L25 [SAR324 cluster bacterium]|nr:50S ribosomal protein L25 [SAR324 cluster bacterium]